MTGSIEFHDTLETRDPAERERALLAALPGQVAFAKANAPAYAEILARVDAAGVTTREALARVPVTRKSELLALQAQRRATDPFGGFAAVTRGPAMPRVFASPGPLYEPEGGHADHWRMARSLFAAGFRSGHLVHNSFSYHMTPGAFLMESGAHAVGCTVFPAGTGQTEQQLQAIADLRPTAFAGTPSFLRILLEKAQEAGTDIASLTKALTGGEALPPSLRDWFGERGLEVYQSYATADLGLIAYETEAREGLVIDEGVLVEIVRPGTGDPVPAGEVGEVVVTALANTDYPLIRFGTGDLSAVLPGRSACGRTNARIKGWMGRADQTTKVKGMFVHPSQVAEIVRRHPAIARARLVVDNPDLQDRMTLMVETPRGAAAEAEAIVASIRDVTKLRGEVSFHAPGTLPNDGKVIEDRRKLD
ncbi:MAG TPA: AMP-binding protein [Casimicrobiaceae bacterium]|nr:AMP-binding protein [Casimicrobiaceae bacterium]